jgi:hypothetical protein
MLRSRAFDGKVIRQTKLTANREPLVASEWLFDLTFIAVFCKELHQQHQVPVERSRIVGMHREGAVQRQLRGKHTW